MIRKLCATNPQLEHLKLTGAQEKHQHSNELAAVAAKASVNLRTLVVYAGHWGALINWQDVLTKLPSLQHLELVRRNQVHFH